MQREKFGGSPLATAKQAKSKKQSLHWNQALWLQTPTLHPWASCSTPDFLSLRTWCRSLTVPLTSSFSFSELNLHCSASLHKHVFNFVTFNFVFR